MTSRNRRSIFIWIGIVQAVFLYVILFHHDVILFAGRYTYEQIDWLVQSYQITELEKRISGLCSSFNIVGLLVNIGVCIFYISHMGGLRKLLQHKYIWIFFWTLFSITIIYVVYTCFEWVYLPAQLLPVELTSLLLLILLFI